jgi:hypothetical protein
LVFGGVETPPYNERQGDMGGLICRSLSSDPLKGSMACCTGVRSSRDTIREANEASCNTLRDANDAALLGTRQSPPFLGSCPA